MIQPTLDDRHHHDHHLDMTLDVAEVLSNDTPNHGHHHDHHLDMTLDVAEVLSNDTPNHRHHHDHHLDYAMIQRKQKHYKQLAYIPL